MINLKNSNIILTGATGGIGGSILDKLESLNANIIAIGTNENKLNKLKEKYKNLNIQKFDISDHSSIEEFIEKCNQYFDNKIDVLINNAGVTSDNLTIRMKNEEWNKVININLTSTFLLSKFTVKKMLKNRNGKIINITSVVGHTGNVGQANYAASKSGIIGMSKSLALEYAKKNININCISPGFIKTNMTEKIDPKFKELILAKIPSNRLGEPSDVANVAAFLSSEMSNYITGETIHVNGGMYLGWQKFFFIY